MGKQMENFSCTEMKFVVRGWWFCFCGLCNIVRYTWFWWWKFMNKVISECAIVVIFTRQVKCCISVWSFGLLEVRDCHRGSTQSDHALDSFNGLTDSQLIYFFIDFSLALPFFLPCLHFSFFFKQEMELSLVGLQSAGKTSLVHAIAVSNQEIFSDTISCSPFLLSFSFLRGTSFTYHFLWIWNRREATARTWFQL